MKKILFFGLFTVLSLSLPACAAMEENEAKQLAAYQQKVNRAAEKDVILLKKGDQCLALLVIRLQPALTKVDCTPEILALIEKSK